MNENLALSFKNFSFIYGTNQDIKPAVSNVNFKLEMGETLILAGPSGSGKTTLHNLIGYIDNPTKGQIMIENQDLSKYADSTLSLFRMKTLGFIYQTLNLIPVLSAQENVEYSLLLDRSLSKKTIKKSVEEMIDSVQLSDYKKTGQTSFQAVSFNG